MCKDGILHKTERRYDSDPWTIMSVHKNGTIRVQHGTKSESLNIEGKGKRLKVLNFVFLNTIFTFTPKNV